MEQSGSHPLPERQIAQYPSHPLLKALLRPLLHQRAERLAKYTLSPL